MGQVYVTAGHEILVLGVIFVFMLIMSAYIAFPGETFTGKCE